jgi:hypothetical protein
MAASHGDIGCLSVFCRSSVSPRLREPLQSLSSLGGGYQSERGKRRTPVDTSLLLPAGVGVLYALLILVLVKYHVQRSQAVHISSEMAEINFALKEGHTIVGVMDTKNAMRFYIGNDVMDEKKHE